MPTYEYRCPACKTDFEKFQRMSDEPVAECPSCGQNAERRLSGGAGFLFKGSGFYITDYRSDNYKKDAGTEGGGSSKPSTGKADAKPEKAATDKPAASETKSSSSTPKAE